MLIWQIYIWKTFDITSFEDTASPLSFPLGWAYSMLQAAHLGIESSGRSQIGTIALPILVIAFALFLVAGIKALRLRSVLDPIYLLQAIVVLSLSPLALTYPKDFFRTCALPLALVIPVAFSDRTVRTGRPVPKDGAALEPDPGQPTTA
ncbi:MAG: hypothetical protein QOK47_333, partial [Actinomycetota bacterium]|nr:hypothetical protein [Actinomycetota bacterium]